MNIFARLFYDEEAGNAVEYGIIAGAIAVGLLAAAVALRKQLVATFTDITTQVANSTK